MSSSNIRYGTRMIQEKASELKDLIEIKKNNDNVLRVTPDERRR